MQKNPHIIQLFACILYMFVFMFLFPIKCPISLGICSTPKLSKYVISLFNAYKAIQWVPESVYLSRFITYGAYVINPDEYTDGGTHWIALYVLNNDITYFENITYMDIIRILRILYVFRQIASRINSIKSRRILIILLHFNISKSMRRNKNFLDP